MFAIIRFIMKQIQLAIILFLLFPSRIDAKKHLIDEVLLLLLSILTLIREGNTPECSI